MYELVSEPLSGARRCARCQNALTPQAAFCGLCGTAAPPPASPLPGPKGRSLRAGDIVLIELVSWLPLVNVIAWLVWMLRPGDPQRARIAQVKLIVSCIILAGAAATILILAALVKGGVLETLPLPFLEWPS